MSSETHIEKKQEHKSFLRMWGTPLAIMAVFALVVAVPVSAGTLNDSVYPLIEDVADLFTPILDLVIASVPVIIATGVIGFLLGLLAKILGHM